jgi:hypothetical protein
MRLLIATLSLAALSMAGCGGEDPFAPPERKAATGSFGVVGGIDELAGKPAGQADEAPKPPPTTTKKAEVGVGKKGHYGGQGFVRTPVATYFRAREKITFNVQIPKAMQLFKVQNNNKGPATHEEFMEKIIKAGMIDLPDLPPGERYLYDPKKEELFIEQQN